MLSDEEEEELFLMDEEVVMGPSRAVRPQIEEDVIPLIEEDTIPPIEDDTTTTPPRPAIQEELLDLNDQEEDEAATYLAARLPQLSSYGEVDSAAVHAMRNDRVNGVVERIFRMMDGVEEMDIQPTLGMEAPVAAAAREAVGGGTHPNLRGDVPNLCPPPPGAPGTYHPLDAAVEQARRRMDHTALDPRCEAMLQSLREATKGLTLHGVLGNSVCDDDLRRFLNTVAQYPTYLEVAADVMRNCHRKGLSFPYVEPMPVRLEDDFRRPPDPGCPWELECPNGHQCRAVELGVKLGVPRPWAARAWVPIYVLAKHWEIQAGVLSGTLGAREAKEAASLLHQQYGPPLPCVMCQCYDVTVNVATVDRNRAAEAEGSGTGAGSTTSSGSIKPVHQCFMHLFNMEGEYNATRMIPGVGRFIGLVAPMAEFSATDFVYVSEAHPRLLGDGPNLPAFRLSADMLFQ